jgi:hypothetical protein
MELAHSRLPPQDQAGDGRTWHLPPFGSARDRPERDRLESETRARLGAGRAPTRRDKRGGAGSRRHRVKATAPASASSTWRPSCASSAHAPPASTRFHAPSPSRPLFIEGTTTGPHLANTACLRSKPSACAAKPADPSRSGRRTPPHNRWTSARKPSLPSPPSLPMPVLYGCSPLSQVYTGIYLVSTQDGLRMLACCLDIARVYG